MKGEEAVSVLKQGNKVRVFKQEESSRVMLSKTDVCASPKYYTCTIIFMAVCMLKVPIPRRYLVCYQKMLRRMFIHECETVSNNVNETTLINMD